MAMARYKPVGLLYDSISNNTGDIAIGIAVSEQLSRMGVRHEVVDPFNYKSEDFEFLVVGGGFLLRDIGDFYYDVFRARGRHFLNAMGVSATQDMSYLNNYRSITVRSTMDKDRVLSDQPDMSVKVIPCTTVLMSPDKSLAEKTKGMVGVQFVADTLKDCPGFEKVINEIASPKALLPFTHYNFDASLMRQANLVGDYMYLDEYSPRKIMGVISDMKYVIVSSLHATIFAYTQNVPFLSFYQPKVNDFLEDRGLSHLIFRNAAELSEKIRLLEKQKPDFSKLITKDKQLVRQHFNEVFGSYAHTVEKEASIKVAPFIAHQKLRLGAKALRHKVQLDENVIAHRDMLIGELIQRNVKLESDLIKLESEKKEQSKRLSKIEKSTPYKLYRVSKKVVRGKRKL